MSAIPRRQPIRPSGFSPDNLTPEILMGIGEIVAHWSYLEFQLGVLLREALNVSMAAERVLIADMHAQPLCRALKTVTLDDTWIKDGKIRDDLRKLAGDVSDSADSRNDVAHGVFGFIVEQDGKHLARYKRRKGMQRIKPEAERVTAESLKEAAEEVRDLGVRAQDLTVHLLAPE
jgi:hypothetical protein